ncbi:MAG: DUF433 domain-containing protein [Caldilineaceae bacterium]|nr:DUF433 domain-containing protein [Caldilineaceae bacterium]
MQQVQELLSVMTKGEKAQVLQWLAQDLSGTIPGIESTPGVLGGDACIVRTRIPVWLLVVARQQGENDARILRSFPTLTAEDLTNAWTYYRNNRNEIDQQISENEAE